MPTNAFASESKLTLENGESITKISELSQPAYSVDYGIEQANIGLPNTVTVTITKAAATEADKPTTRTTNANVVWNGTHVSGLSLKPESGNYSVPNNSFVPLLVTTGFALNSDSNYTSFATATINYEFMAREYITDSNGGTVTFLAYYFP